MERRYRHPDSGVERILEELAQQGGDLGLIDDFAKRAAERAAAKIAGHCVERSAMPIEGPPAPSLA